MAAKKVEFVSDGPAPPKRRGQMNGLWLVLPVLAVVGLLFFLTREKPTKSVVTAQEPIKPEVVLRIHGSNTLGAAFLPTLAESYLKSLGAERVMQQTADSPVEKVLMAQLPNKKRPVVIEIKAHGSSTGIKSLQDGVCDIAASSRPIKSKEAELLSRLGLGVMTSSRCETVIALDGVAVIVHPENPINRLNVEEIARIFSGDVKNWEEISDYRGLISVYARDNKSGTFDTFKSLVLGKTRTINSWAVRFEDSVMLYESVMNDPMGIGFIGLPYIRQAKVLGVSESNARAFKPNYMSVKSEDYVLSRRLFLYAGEHSKNPHIANFIDYARSDEGQRLVRQSNLVDLSLDVETPTLAKKEAIGSERYQALVRNAEFVVTIRFNASDNSLDNRALDDLSRFYQLMAHPEYKKRQVILLGHTDITGDQNENLSLSKQRAMEVAKHLKEKGITGVVSEGFGVEIPVASNESPKGRQRNRRVEIFLGA